MAQELEAAGHRVIERLSRERPADAPPLLSGVIVTVGQRPRIQGGGLNPSPTLNPESNIATIEFKLLGAQQREISTIDFVQAWREEVGVLPYARGITFSGEVIDLGNPVEAVMSHPDPDRLVQIANSVVDGLREVGGVYDVRSDHTPGIPEIQLELRPEARTLGLTLESLAGQARAAIFGAEAVRVQRGPGRSAGLRPLARRRAEFHHGYRRVPATYTGRCRGPGYQCGLAEIGYVAAGHPT